MFLYTFDTKDQNKFFTLTAKYKNLFDSIQISCKKSEELDPGQDPILEDKISGSFPTGLPDSYFSIIYHTSPLSPAALAKTLNVNELNESARLYLSYINPDSDENFNDKLYYGQDDNGIFVAIPTTVNQKIYNNVVYKYNDDGSPASYKVYIAGTCDIIDIGYLPNNVNLTLANGYYYEIENTLYLFLNTRLNMVCFSTDSSGSTDYKQFWYKDDEENKKVLKNNLLYYSDSYYLKHSEDKQATNLSLKEDAMMITGGVIDLIVTSNTITSIEHFNACANIGDIILSDNLINIGDYAFTNGSLSSDVTMMSENSKVERIGRYAFSGCPNIKLFQDNEGNTKLPDSIKYIDEKAFYSAPGLKGIDISDCTQLRQIGEKAFSECGNLQRVIYRQYQIEPDNINSTQLLYLPPMENIPRTSGHAYSGTASTLYTDEEYNDLISKGIITDIEKQLGQQYLTFYQTRNGSGLYWRCR